MNLYKRHICYQESTLNSVCALSDLNVVMTDVILIQIFSSNHFPRK